MSVTFDKALRDGVALLIDLPKNRAGAKLATARLERFRKNHPDVHAALLQDRPPGSLNIDYDLLLDSREGGTIELTYHRDGGNPWKVEYADHWAANFVVSVNEDLVTIQDALLYLNLQAQSLPDLMTQIVNQELIAQEIQKAPSPPR